MKIRGLGFVVVLGSILVDFLGEPNLYQNLGDFTRNREGCGGCLTGGTI